MNGRFLPVSIENIPKELKVLHQWVLWRGVKRGDRWTKIPYSVVGDKASSTDGSTWADFDTVVERYKNGSFDGIGFVFAEGGGLTGIDLDHCFDEGGHLNPKTAAIVRALSSYAEYSVSGNGLHVIVQAILKKGFRTSERSMIDIPVEIYPHGKYFTMTGRVFGEPSAVKDSQNVVDYLAGIVSPIGGRGNASSAKSKQQYLGNDELIKRAMSARNGEKFKRLWSGDASMYGGDASRADAAFFSILMFWTKGDRERADCLFRLSGLYREDKWGNRPDYRKRTMDFVSGARN
jgi:primase-polymerase (primpol)-like protein